jgi:hypothetical protein
MRTPVCELIDHSVPRGRVRLIEHVLDWIENRATQQDILNDGFTDRHTMGLFFLDRYRISDLQGTWMIPKWYPCIGVIS